MENIRADKTNPVHFAADGKAFTPAGAKMRNDDYWKLESLVEAPVHQELSSSRHDVLITPATSGTACAHYSPEVRRRFIGDVSGTALKLVARNVAM